MYVDGEFNIRVFDPFAKTIINTSSLKDPFIDFKERFDLGFCDHMRIINKVTISAIPDVFFISLLCCFA